MHPAAANTPEHVDHPVRPRTQPVNAPRTHGSIPWADVPDDHGCAGRHIDDRNRPLDNMLRPEVLDVGLAVDMADYGMADVVERVGRGVLFGVLAH